MYTLLKPVLVRKELLKKGVRIFTPQVFSRIFASRPTAAKYFLKTQTQGGLLMRLKRGVYALKTDPPSEEEIANALYGPSYISFEYALAHYNILPEITYTITSATTKPTRVYVVDKTTYSYRTMKESAYTGYSLIKKENHSFLLAEAEKALIDYFYFIGLGKTALNDCLFVRLKEQGYYKTGTLRKEKIIHYSKIFNNKQLDTVVRRFI